MTVVSEVTADSQSNDQRRSLFEKFVSLDHQRLHLLFLLRFLPVVQAHPVLQLLLDRSDLLLQRLHLCLSLLVVLPLWLALLAEPLLHSGLLCALTPHLLLPTDFLRFLLEHWPIGPDRRIALVLGPEELHEHYCALLDDLPLDELERVSINLEAHQFHEAEDSGESGEVVVFEVEVVEALLAEDVVGDVVDDVVADVQYFKAGKTVLEEQQLDGADLVVGEVKGAQLGDLQDGLGHLVQPVGRQVQVQQRNEEGPVEEHEVSQPVVLRLNGLQEGQLSDAFGQLGELIAAHNQCLQALQSFDGLGDGSNLVAGEVEHAEVPFEYELVQFVDVHGPENQFPIERELLQQFVPKLVGRDFGGGNQLFLDVLTVAGVHAVLQVLLDGVDSSRAYVLADGLQRIALHLQAHQPVDEAQLGRQVRQVVVGEVQRLQLLQLHDIRRDLLDLVVVEGEHGEVGALVEVVELGQPVEGERDGVQPLRPGHLLETSEPVFLELQQHQAARLREGALPDPLDLVFIERQGLQLGAPPEHLCRNLHECVPRGLDLPHVFTQRWQLSQFVVADLQHLERPDAREVRQVDQSVFCEVELNESGAERVFLGHCGNAVAGEVEQLEHLQASEAGWKSSQGVVLHAQQLQVGEEGDLVGDGCDLVVGEVHLGDGHAVPPVLLLERQVLEAEEGGRDLLGLLADVVEGAGLHGALDRLREGLLLNHRFKLKSQI